MGRTTYRVVRGTSTCSTTRTSWSACASGCSSRSRSTSAGSSSSTGGGGCSTHTSPSTSCGRSHDPVPVWLLPGLSGHLPHRHGVRLICVGALLSMMGVAGLWVCAKYDLPAVPFVQFLFMWLFGIFTMAWVVVGGFR